MNGNTEKLYLFQGEFDGKNKFFVTRNGDDPALKDQNNQVIGSTNVPIEKIGEFIKTINTSTGKTADEVKALLDNLLK